MPARLAVAGVSAPHYTAIEPSSPPKGRACLACRATWLSAHGVSRLPEEELARLFVYRRLRIDLFALLVGTYHSGPLTDRFEPALEMRKVLELLLLTLVRHDPRIARHVSNRVSAGNVLTVREPAIE